MSEANYKVGDVVMSIYPPDGDDTYYNAKIVEVGEGEGENQIFQVLFTDPDYDGDPPVEVTRSGLKKKAKKKPRMKRQLNPNFAKAANTATDSVAVVTAPKPSTNITKPSAPKELRAPPTPTGAGANVTISQSDALAAVAALEIDNWEGQEGNEENRGHLFALTDSSAKWKEVRDALLQVKLKAKELHFEFQCLETKVPEISFFFYHHVTGKKGKNVVHFYNSNINIVNECLEAMTLCLLHPTQFPSSLLPPLETCAYEFLPRSQFAKKIFEQLVTVKGLKGTVDRLIAMTKGEKSPKNLIATLDVIGEFATEFGVNQFDVTKFLQFTVGLLDTGRGVKEKAKELLMLAYRQAGAQLAKLLKMKAKSFGLAPKKVKFLLQDFEKISPTGLSDAQPKAAERVFGPDNPVPGSQPKAAPRGNKSAPPPGDKATPANKPEPTAHPKPSGGGFDLGIPALDLSKYDEYDALMTKLGNTSEQDYRDAWKHRVAALEQLQVLISESVSGFAINRECVDLVRVVGARIDDKNMNLQLKALKAAEMLVGVLPPPEIPKLINLVTANTLVCFAAKKVVTVAAVAALDAWVQGEAGVDLPPVHIDKMLGPCAKVLKERQAAREGLLGWMQKHFARASTQRPPLVNLTKASKTLTKVLVACLLDRQSPVRKQAQEVLVQMLSCGGEFVQAAKKRLNSEITKVNAASQRQLKSVVEDIYFRCGLEDNSKAKAKGGGAGASAGAKKTNAKRPAPKKANAKPTSSSTPDQDARSSQARTNNRNAGANKRKPNRGGRGGGSGHGDGSGSGGVIKMDIYAPGDTEEQTQLKRELEAALRKHDYDRVAAIAGELKKLHHNNTKLNAKKAKLAELQMQVDEAAASGNYGRVAELAQEMKKIQQEDVGAASPIRATNDHHNDAPSPPHSVAHSAPSTPGVPLTPDSASDGKPPIGRARRGRMGMLPANEKPNGSIPRHPGGAGSKHPGGAAGKRLNRKAAELQLEYQVSDCRQLLNELEGEAVAYTRAQERLRRLADKADKDYERKHLNDEMMQKKHVVIPSLAKRLKSGRQELSSFLKEYKSVLAGCFDVKKAKQLLKDSKVKILKLVESHILERHRPGSADTPTKGNAPFQQRVVPPRKLVSEPKSFRASVNRSLADHLREKEKSMRAPPTGNFTPGGGQPARNLKRNAVNTARLDPLATSSS